MPHLTTPFELATEYLDDEEALRRVLIVYYSENWRDVRTKIEARLSTYSIDDEAKATLREALDAHEIAHYRCVCRLLFPEIERLFRGAFFGGRAGSIPHRRFVNRLVGSEKGCRVEQCELNDGGPFLEDFLTGGIHELAVFGYLTEGLKERFKRRRTSAMGEYVPGLFVGISDANIEAARGSAIPTRHAVVHGLVSYPTEQNSLNAIFIADYVFSVMSQLDQDTLTSPSADAESRMPNAKAASSEAMVGS